MLHPSQGRPEVVEDEIVDRHLIEVAVDADQ
jgi:hypothetical protein